MKRLLKTLAVLYLIGIFSSCSSKGPKDEVVIDNIKTHLMGESHGCQNGPMITTINEIKIVGRVKKEDNIVVQATGNLSRTGPFFGAGTFKLEITIAYEKFGDSWREAANGFDYTSKQ
jgi:hypothetical protein